MPETTIWSFLELACSQSWIAPIPNAVMRDKPSCLLLFFNMDTAMKKIALYKDLNTMNNEKENTQTKIKKPDG